MPNCATCTTLEICNIKTFAGLKILTVWVPKKPDTKSTKFFVNKAAKTFKHALLAYNRSNQATKKQAQAQNKTQ